MRINHTQKKEAGAHSVGKEWSSNRGPLATPSALGFTPARRYRTFRPKFTKAHYGPPASPMSAIKQQKENGHVLTAQRAHMRINHTHKKKKGFSPTVRGRGFHQTVAPWQHPRLRASHQRGGTVPPRPEFKPSRLPTTRRAARECVGARGLASAQWHPRQCP